MSSAELARRSKFSRSIVSLWEAEKRELSGSDRLYEGFGKAFGVSVLTLKSYLDGDVPLSAVLAEGPLDQALMLNEGQWSEVSVAVARELEGKMTKAQARTRSRITWIRQLDALEKEFRASLPTRLERLLSDEDPFDDQPAPSAPSAKRSKRTR